MSRKTAIIKLNAAIDDALSALGNADLNHDEGHFIEEAFNSLCDALFDPEVRSVLQRKHSAERID